MKNVAGTEAVFAQKLRSIQDAEQRLLAEVAANAHRAAAQYTPVAINRPAPKFALDDLTGQRLDNQAAKDKPLLCNTLIDLLATVCSARLLLMAAYFWRKRYF